METNRLEENKKIDYLGNIYEIKLKTKTIILLEEFENNEIYCENCYIIDQKNNVLIHSGIADFFYFRDGYLKDKSNQYKNVIRKITYTEENQVDEYLDILFKDKKVEKVEMIDDIDMLDYEDKDYILIEDIAENDDLHEIAKKIKYEDGNTFISRLTTRQQFLEEIIIDIEWKMEMVGSGINRATLHEAYIEALQIREIEDNLIKDDNGYIFEFDNGMTFDTLKKEPIESLDYEIKHDLASVYNEGACVSVYLGVYDNEFTLTFSIHSNQDYYGDFENMDCLIISLEDITTEEQLKNLMVQELKNFSLNYKEKIELYSKEIEGEKNDLALEQ